MFKNKPIILLSFAISLMCVGCSFEDIQVEAPKSTGVLCLSMSSDEVYIQTGTRAVQPLADWSDYSFTLSNGSPLVFADGKAVLEEGDYVLTVTNANAASVDNGYKGPLYSGTTNFSIQAGTETQISLELGKPKNAKVSLALSQGFTDNYHLATLTLSNGTRSQVVTHETINGELYFPASNATTLNYTLIANAIEGTHVQDITSAQGTISISSGEHTTFTLNVNPIDPTLITLETGADYGGVFE